MDLRNGNLFIQKVGSCRMDVVDSQGEARVSFAG
jgi:hypothetical protein